MRTTDKTTLAYWEQIQRGDLIQLSDEQTIADLMEDGCQNIEHGADFEVTRIRKISAQQGSARWLIFDISLSSFQWVVVVKSVGVGLDVKVCYTPDDFNDGSRQDMMDNDCLWLFENRDNIDSSTLSELTFASCIEEGEDTIYSTNGSEFGECREYDEKSFATITEYLTESDVENPELIILEFNNIEEWSNSEEQEDEDDFEEISVEHSSGVTIDEENSFITFLQGCRVDLNDIKLLK
jgi:hypothetical protein